MPELSAGCCGMLRVMAFDRAAGTGFITKASIFIPGRAIRLNALFIRNEYRAVGLVDPTRQIPTEDPEARQRVFDFEGEEVRVQLRVGRAGTPFDSQGGGGLIAMVLMPVVRSSFIEVEAEQKGLVRDVCKSNKPVGMLGADTEACWWGQDKNLLIELGVLMVF